MREALQREAKLRGAHETLAKIYEATHHPEWAAIEKQREEAVPVPECGMEAGACAFLMGYPDATMQATRFARLPEDLYWRFRAASVLRDQAYQKLQALPESVQASSSKAERMRRLGLHAEAVLAWRKAISLAKGSPLLEKELAVSLYDARDFAECLRLADRLIKADPDDADLQLLRGDASLSVQDAATALPHLERAAALNPGLLAAYGSLGRALMQLNRPAEAIPHLEQALLDDSDGGILFQLSQAYRQIGKADEAQAALTRYQQILNRNQAEKASFEQRSRIVAP